MIDNAFKVREKKTGNVYDAIPQAVSNITGKYFLCWNIGINGYNEWSNICMVYGDEEFNGKYDVVKYSKAKKEYIPEVEYKFWIDGVES